MAYTHKLWHIIRQDKTNNTVVLVITNYPMQHNKCHTIMILHTMICTSHSHYIPLSNSTSYHFNSDYSNDLGGSRCKCGVNNTGK